MLETSLGYLAVQLTEAETSHVSIRMTTNKYLQSLTINVVLRVVSFPNKVEVTLLETSLGCLTVELTEAKTCHVSTKETQG